MTCLGENLPCFFFTAGSFSKSFSGSVSRSDINGREWRLRQLGFGNADEILHTSRYDSRRQAKYLAVRLLQAHVQKTIFLRNYFQLYLHLLNSFCISMVLIPLT